MEGFRWRQSSRLPLPRRYAKLLRLPLSAEILTRMPEIPPVAKAALC